MIKIKDTSWDDEDDFLKFKKHLIKIKKKIINTDYNFYWDGCSNHIKITKFLGNIGEDRMLIIASTKIFRLKSTYGINNGRISKLSIYWRGDYPNQFVNHKSFFNYDRGDDVNKLDENKEARLLYDFIIKYFN